MILHGDGTWPFMSEVSEIIVKQPNLVATWFGGTDDPEDNGQTASGFSTKRHPEVQACSLPMEFGFVRAVAGAPIPRLPWGLDSKGNDIATGAHVHVVTAATGLPIVVPLVDLGPAKSATPHRFGQANAMRGAMYRTRARTAKANGVHAIDLTKPAFIALGGDPKVGILKIAAFRIFSLA